jgi:hypothetical protein
VIFVGGFLDNKGGKIVGRRGDFCFQKGDIF